MSGPGRKLLRVAAKAEHWIDSAIHRAKLRLDIGDDFVVTPYRGYVDDRGLWLKGRVVERPNQRDLDADASDWRNIMQMLGRYRSDEVPHAEVACRLGDATVRLQADREGFFAWREAISPERGSELSWEEATATLVSPLREDQEAQPQPVPVMRPGHAARLGVVSDIDDTIVVTGAEDWLTHTKTVLTNNAKSREPFPGVAELYTDLQNDADGVAQNPFFYVSSSPWNLYDLFEDFMAWHGIPLGPIFLKDFGMEQDRLLKTGHGEHKLALVEALIEGYADLQWLLIGDTGQKDALIYAEVAEKHGARLAGVMLRATDGPLRPEVRDACEVIRKHQTPMLVASDSEEMRKFCAQHGWIA